MLSQRHIYIEFYLIKEQINEKESNNSDNNIDAQNPNISFPQYNKAFHRIIYAHEMRKLLIP